MLNKVPLSIYIHLPWCIHKCPYCDFNSHEVNQVHFEDEKKHYVYALIKQIKSSNDDRPIKSVFFGGGTPSLFNPHYIQEIIDVLKSQFNFETNCEINLEANPGTIDYKHFEGFAKAGVNRVSLGIQSFNDDHLKKLERIHDGQTAYQIAQDATKIFNRVNLDLMFGLPHQTHKELMNDLERALSLKTQHLSYYNLTIEPNTLFYKYPPKLPEDDLIFEFQSSIHQILKGGGFNHYETSAYAKTDEQCLHNLNYWQFGDYLGFGAGAHGKLTKNNMVFRYSCYKNPKQYMNESEKHNFFIEEKKLSRNDLIFEFMMNALRLNDGFKKKLFFDRTNIELKEIEDELDVAQDKGHIEVTNDMIKPTLQGQNYLNDLLQIFLKDH